MGASPDSSGPRAEYEHRLGERMAMVAEFDARSAKLSYWRVAVFGLILATLAIAYLSEAVPFWVALILTLGFATLVVIHENAIRRLDRAQLAVAYYERGLRRIDDRWEGDGLQGTDYASDDHPYAAALDLFGPGSLFELLCRARTRAGEGELARWLMAPSDATVVRARQEAVDDLRGRLDLREDLALLGGDVRAQTAPEVVITWGEAEPFFSDGAARTLRLLAWLVPSLVLASAVAWATTCRREA